MPEPGRLRCLVVYAVGERNSSLSYMRGYPRHFAAHPCYAAVPINLLSRAGAWKLRASLLLAARYDAIILLHSVFSNVNFLTGPLFDAVRRSRLPVVFFIGNEYKLMPEKMRFCEEMGVAMLVSQSLSPEIHRIYAGRLGCAVAGLPNSCFDTGVFRPGPALAERPIDIGYRAYPSVPYLGHWERETIAEQIRAAALPSQTLDLSLDPADRFDEPGWAEFLARCKCQLGVESGSDVFELTDSTRKRVNAHIAAGGDSDQATIGGLLPPRSQRVSLRTMSSRIIEAAAAFTPQILYRGHYDGMIEADDDYLALDKDGGNASDIVARLVDLRELEAMAGRIYAKLSDRLAPERVLREFRQTVRVEIGI